MGPTDISSQQASPWDEVVRRASTTPDFRQKLLASPEQALQEMGIEVPEGTRIVVHETNAKELNIFLPSDGGGRETAKSYHAHYTTVEPQMNDQPSAIRTTIRDISAIGPLLDEGRLVTAMLAQSKDGGSDSTGGPCGSCH